VSDDFDEYGEAMKIVSDLAVADPVLLNGLEEWECSLCAGEDGYGGKRSVSHKDTCPWIRARNLVARHKSTID